MCSFWRPGRLGKVGRRRSIEGLRLESRAPMIRTSFEKRGSKSCKVYERRLTVAKCCFSMSCFWKLSIGRVNGGYGGFTHLKASASSDARSRIKPLYS